ncbi:MAG: sulfotransferase domain-containing protein, partial [Pirellulales bacterium]
QLPVRQHLSLGPAAHRAQVGMSEGLVWLASYPKSGNTWVRAVWAAYVADGEPFDFKLLQAATISDSRWKNILAVSPRKSPRELSNTDVEALRLAFQRRLANASGPTRPVKTHVARTNAAGTPLISARHTRAAVYIVRNPLDIVDSLSDHGGLTHDRTIEFLNDRGHTLARDELMAAQYLGTWNGHVASWTEHREFPVVVVRYEDLHRDPRTQFAGVVELLAGKVEPERLERAIARASFQNLRTLEGDTAFQETSVLARGGRFFRRGQDNFWPNVLSRRQAATVLENHGEVMSRLGYELTDLDRVYGE